MTCNTSAVAVCCSSASRCLGDQPRILHRDHRLRREVLQQRDLFLRERPDLLAVGSDEAEQGIVLAQRHEKHGAQSAYWATGLCSRIVGPLLGQFEQIGKCGRLARRRAGAQAENLVVV